VFREDFQSGLTERWVERGFPSIARKNLFSVGLEADGNRYLRVESDDSYSARGIFVSLSPQRCPEVSWRWRVSDVIATADIGRTELAVGLLAARGSSAAGAVSAATGEQSCRSLDHRHAAWTAILRRFVHEGQVDYGGLLRDGQDRLSRYLQALASVCRDDYAHRTRDQRLAFWINAYNAYTVRLVLDNYPLSSIRSIGLLPGAAFRTAFIASQLRDRPLSLHAIEHEILRKEFSEPRIHFAIVCASESCPVLRSEAYRAAALDRQLDEQARRFIRDPSKNRFDAATRVLYLSSIFDWFREDFERGAGTLVGYVARYADEPTATSLRQPGVRVKFLEYDWSLNGR
jgi:hypothetical protein